jgi:hypothetical protein
LLRLLLILLLLLSVAVPASARTIDEFSNSSVFFFSSSGPGAGEAIASDFGRFRDSICGHRRLVFGGTIAEGGTASIRYGTIDGAAEIVGLAGSQGTLTFLYDDDDLVIEAPIEFGLEAEDLTDDGTADRIAVEVSGIDNPTAGLATASIRIRLYEDETNYLESPVSIFSSSGTLEFPFSGFSTIGAGVDPGEVRSIEVRVQGIDEGETITIDRIASRGPALIDEFTNPRIDSSTLQLQSDPDVFGGTRTVSPANGAEFAILEGLGLIMADGTPSGFVSLTWGAAAPPFDLTSGGEREHLLVDVQGVSGTFNLSAQLLDPTTLVFDDVFFPDVTAGLLEIPLAHFEQTDPTAVGAIRLVGSSNELADLYVDRIGIERPPAIDDFGDTHAPVSFSSSQVGNTIEGGEREIVLVTSDGRFETAGGGFELVAGNTDDVDALLIYDGAGDETTGSIDFGLGSLDLTAFGRNAFGIDVQSVTTPFAMEIRIFTTDSAGSASLIKEISAPGLATFPFAQFSGSPSADFADVDAIQLFLGTIPSGESVVVDRVVTLSKGADFIAGWDFGQYAGPGAPTLDGVTTASQVPAVYSDLDETFGAGIESTHYGTMYLDGTSGSTPGGGALLVPTSDAISLLQDLPRNGLPNPDVGFDAGTVQAVEGTTAFGIWQDVSMLSQSAVEVVFEADVSSTGFVGSGWFIELAGLSSTGGGTIDVEWSADGSSYTHVQTLSLGATEQAYRVSAPSTLDGDQVVFARLGFNEANLLIDNVGVSARRLPEPAGALPLAAGVGILWGLSRRRSRRIS